MNQEQKVLASCALASAAVNVRLKNQDDSLSAQGQLLVDQGELLSRIHADMKERLRDQDQRLSAQGRLLSRILEVLDNGRLADVDTEFAEGSDDKPRRVTLRACASKRSVPDSGSLAESCVKVARPCVRVSELLAPDRGSLAGVVTGFDPAGTERLEPIATCGAVVRCASGTCATAAQGLQRCAKPVVCVSGKQSGVPGVSWLNNHGAWQVSWYEEKKAEKKHFFVRHFMATSKTLCEA